MTGGGATGRQALVNINNKIRMSVCLFVCVCVCSFVCLFEGLCMCVLVCLCV